jgi:hypothetical protein
MSEQTTRVKKRRISHIPGYDPIHPCRYRELYRKEGAAQAQISDYEIGLQAAPSQEMFRWDVAARIDGQDVGCCGTNRCACLVRYRARQHGADDTGDLSATDPDRVGLHHDRHAAPPDVDAQGADDRGTLSGVDAFGAIGCWDFRGRVLGRPCRTDFAPLYLRGQQRAFHHC